MGGAQLDGLGIFRAGPVGEHGVALGVFFHIHRRCCGEAEQQGNETKKDGANLSVHGSNVAELRGAIQTPHRAGDAPIKKPPRRVAFVY